MADQPIARHISVQYDERGNPIWRTVMSPPDNSFGKCYMVPDRVIPVIFVPGVMGSNLIERGADPKDAIKWRLDSRASVGVWAFNGPKKRKRYLRPEVMEVDRDGAVSDDAMLPAEELRRRGWGEIAALSYQDILMWLEKHLNDFDNCRDSHRLLVADLDLKAMKGEQCPTRDEIGLTFRYRFPVYACGYNWLASNADSAQRLSDRIDEVIRRYRAEKKKVEKVIIITHSMGGLVARCCSEVLGRSKDIMGIVHGVMPAIGAAAVYRRFKSGTEGDFGTSATLGGNAAAMTAVLSTAPGPMQLLPSAEYGNGWLKIKDAGNIYALPQHGDPYSEIYTVRGKWWSMCEDQLINPLNEERDTRNRFRQQEQDWNRFCELIDFEVKKFHIKILQKYHPNTHAFFGSSDKHRAYGTVTWQGDGGGWLRGERGADVLNARTLDSEQIHTDRTVAAPLEGTGWLKGEHQTYTISEPDEAGDGTVPHRSGIAPQHACRSLLCVPVEHEPAFKPSENSRNMRAAHFTLRAIVHIAQDVKNTSLRYD